jgi:hypothetical protein
MESVAEPRAIRDKQGDSGSGSPPDPADQKQRSKKAEKDVVGEPQLP